MTDVGLDLSPPSLCAHAQPSTYQGVKPRSRARRPPLQLLLAGLVPGLHNDCGVGHCGVGHPCTLQIISQCPDRRRQRGHSPSHKGVRCARNQSSKTCPTEVACVGSSKLVLVTTHRQAAEHHKVLSTNTSTWLMCHVSVTHNQGQERATDLHSRPKHPRSCQ